jgi:5-methylthioadenosine/S-adenosylhomocysteine deaminase
MHSATISLAPAARSSCSSTDSDESATVLEGCMVLTMDAQDRRLASADIRIVGKDIAAIGAAGSLHRPGDQAIDCRHALVIPGLVNTHTHAGAGMFRGLTEDLPREYWRDAYGVPNQQRFQEEDYRLAAQASCLEFLSNGVTCIADRWSGMDAISDSINASGIRAVVGHTLLDASAPADWKTVDAQLEKWGTSPRSRMSAGIAPHAPDTCSDALLRSCASRAEDEGCKVFIHLAQSAYELVKLRSRGYDGALACLANNGLAGPQTVAAHCIYLTPKELDEWGLHGTSVAHCPASNLKIEARTVPVHRLIGRAAVGLGTDWAASDNAMDILAEARLAAMIGKHLADDPTALPIATMLRMATIEGARALGLDAVIGSVEVGKRADLVVMDLEPLEANPPHDQGANLLYSMSTRCVRDVLVDGRILVRDRKLPAGALVDLKRDLARRWSVWQAQ